MAETKRGLDRQVAEKYFGMGWIQDDEDASGDELYAWDHHPADPFWPPFTHYYYGAVPRYSTDPAAAALVEQKLEEYGCAEEYARALVALGASPADATPEQRCRAAVEVHPFYEARVKEAAEAQSRESNRAFNEQKERAAALITRLRERLVRLSEERPFRFVNTYREEAEDYLRRLTEFRGFDEYEIYGARTTRGLFPHVYTEFMRQMGHARGALFAGSEAEPSLLRDYEGAAYAMLERCGVEPFLDAYSAVFMLHQGYSFCYFQTAHGPDFDAPVFQYTECDPAPKQVAPGFAEFLDAELSLMEENNRLSRESGGYFITVAGGFERRLYPALDEGRTPLDSEDELL